jgi:hypothetical protein
MVINIMTFAPARDDRIPVRLSILESLVSMLNVAETESAMMSRFQNALHAKFDSWIEKEKADPSPEDQYEFRPWMLTMGHRLGDEGIAVFFLDFEPPRGSTGPLTPEHEAFMWFALFLTITGRKLLSRCSKCGRYFLRKRLPKGGEQPIFGDFCPEHRSQVRVLSTKADRKRKLDRLIKRAAVFAAKWNERKHIKLRDWIVQQFNSNLGRNQPMKKKWVSQHMKEIQLEMARLGASRIK